MNHLGNCCHSGALLHEELNLGESFWHSLSFYLSFWQSNIAVVLSYTI